MKRFLALLLVLSMVFVLYGCGSPSSESITAAEDPSTTSGENPSNPPEEIIQFMSDNTITNTTEIEATEEPQQLIFDEKYAEPIVILDDDIIKVTVLGRYEDRSSVEHSNPAFYKLGFKLLIENKTDDKYLSIGLGNVSIDGVMNDGYYGDCWVSPQAKSYPTLVFNRMVGQDDRHPNVETWEDIVNVRGVIHVYFNTDGGKSGKGLEKAEFQFD